MSAYGTARSRTLSSLKPTPYATPNARTRRQKQRAFARRTSLTHRLVTESIEETEAKTRRCATGTAHRRILFDPVLKRYLFGTKSP